MGKTFISRRDDNTGKNNKLNSVYHCVVAGFDRRRRLSSCRNGVPPPSQADPVEKLHPEEKAKGEG
jgi:hypothetical protein